MVSAKAATEAVASSRPYPYPVGVLFAIWLMVGAGFGLICGLLAIRRNRSATLWWMLGLLVGPIALVALLTMERREAPAFL